MIASETAWGTDLPEKFAQKLMLKANYDDNVRVPPGTGYANLTPPVLFFAHNTDTHEGVYFLACGHSVHYRTGSDFFPRMVAKSGISPFPCKKCEGAA